jgi:hypothetical protein
LTDFPAVLVPNRISTLLDAVRRLNKPARLNRTWLEANGFRSKNDRALASLLRSLGYIDANGAPTPEYDRLRGSEAEARASLGTQMGKAYPDVFKNFSSKHVEGQLSREELANFVRPKIAAGDATVQNIVATFFALKTRADFTDGPTSQDSQGPVVAMEVPAVAQRSFATASPSGDLNVTIALSLEIPATSDADVYDKLFAAMAKHLGAMMGRGGGD